MVTLEPANKKYSKAIEKYNEGKVEDSIDLLSSAAEEYMKTIPELKGREKEFAQNRIDTCIYKIREFTEPLNKKIIQNETNTHSFKMEYSNMNFSDVAGMCELKRKLEDAIINPLVNPESMKYVDDYSRGIVMYGPPGCGKTHVAKATAGEASKRSGRKVGFFYIRTSDLVRSLVGDTEQNIRKLFENAAENAPSIIFLDELDSIGMTRSSDSDYAHRFLTELLQDFSIIEDKQVLTLAATNYPSAIDPALLRPGRFDENILVEPPDLEARTELFELYTKKKPIKKNNIDYKQLAVFTQDYSAADIRKICNEAGRLAQRDYLKGEKNRKIEQKDLLLSIRETKPSIYFWIDEADSLIRQGKMAPVFGEKLSDLVEHVNARRYNNED